MLYLFLFGPPLVIYLSLARLPQGRAAKIGIATSAFALGLVWLVTGWGSDAYIGPVLVLAAGAIGLAALVQGLRGLLGSDRPGWTYPALVVLAVLGLAFPLILFLGI